MNNRAEIHNTKATTTPISVERGSTILFPMDRGFWLMNAQIGHKIFSEILPQRYQPRPLGMTSWNNDLSSRLLLRLMSSASAVIWGAVALLESGDCLEKVGPWRVGLLLNEFSASWFVKYKQRALYIPATMFSLPW